jgi:enamine deaminase RidA (YjgF/YER057c/UK114 family)
MQNDTLVRRSGGRLIAPAVAIAPIMSVARRRMARDGKNSNSTETPMNTFLNPPDLSRPNGFVHVATSTFQKTIMVSGQVAYDPEGRIVGVGDLAAQTHRVYTNIETALKAAGASMKDIVKTTLFVRHLDADKARIIREVRKSFLSPDQPPASTMIGVISLAHPDLLLEVEAIAMVA